MISQTSGVEMVKVGWQNAVDPDVASAAVFTNPDRGLPFPETSPSCVPYGHSMFEIVLDRRRRGWSTLGEAMMVPVVPSRRDGHLRS
jgi:hypothetical protein